MDCSRAPIRAVVGMLAAVVGAWSAAGPTSVTKVAAVFSGKPHLLVVHGYSTSFHWPQILQRKLDRHFGERVVEVVRATKGGTPIARWMDVATGQRKPAWAEVVQPALAARANRPATVLAQQSLQWVYGDRREGIRGPGDGERIGAGADAIGRYAELLLEDGADAVVIAMHIYKHPMEPEIGHERLALAALLAREPERVFAGPDVWEPTKARYPEVFAEDRLHPNDLGAHIMAQAWFEALLAREGLAVPAWSRQELEADLKP